MPRTGLWKFVYICQQKITAMKTKVVLLLIAAALCIAAAIILIVGKPKPTPATDYTNIVVSNLSDVDSVKVYLTIQAPNSVVGLFGILASDTGGSCSKGFFYALKGKSYSSGTATSLPGVVMSFNGDNNPCQVTVPKGYLFGINIFEASINMSSECFDLSCEDGVNSILRVWVSDTVNWATGEGDYVENFRAAENTFPLLKNIGIRGVFPYRCTDCKDMKAPVPENCFNLKDTCNVQRICQVARTNHIGGVIHLDYISPALVPCIKQ
jgi:hypothetical protein